MPVIFTKKTIYYELTNNSLSRKLSTLSLPCALSVFSNLSFLLYFVADLTGERFTHTSARSAWAWTLTGAPIFTMQIKLISIKVRTRENINNFQNEYFIDIEINKMHAFRYFNNFRSSYLRNRFQGENSSRIHRIFSRSRMRYIRRWNNRAGILV